MLLFQGCGAAMEQFSKLYITVLEYKHLCNSARVDASQLPLKIYRHILRYLHWVERFHNIIYSALVAKIVCRFYSAKKTFINIVSQPGAAHYYWLFRSFLGVGLASRLRIWIRLIEMVHITRFPHSFPLIILLAPDLGSVLPGAVLPVAAH
jgi:hypothetical protein